MLIILFKICCYIFIIPSFFYDKLSNIFVNDKESYLEIKPILPSLPKIINASEFKAKYDLSIIIPAYNVEKYIVDCLDSIFDDEYTFTFEVIVIDDKSVDNTLKILERYKDKYNFCLLKSDVNGGISVARNKGIEYCSGRNMTFLDSDDIFIKGALNTLMKYILLDDNLEMIQGEVISFSDTSELNIDFNENIVVENKCDIGRFSGYACGKIYKSSVFDDIRFPVGTAWEDGIISNIIFKMLHKYSKTNCCLYGYRQNRNSISHTIKEHNRGIDHVRMLAFYDVEFKRLNIVDDEHSFKVFLKEATRYLMSRTKYMSKGDLKYIFNYIYIIISSKQPQKYKLSIIEKIALYAIKNNYVYLWKTISYII